MAPYADRLLTIGTGAGCLGSGREVLTALALAVGDVELAREHARAAVALHRRLGTPYLIERAEKALAELT
jgi:hypothetical protein